VRRQLDLALGVEARQGDGARRTQYAAKRWILGAARATGREARDTVDVDDEIRRATARWIGVIRGGQTIQPIGRGRADHALDAGEAEADMRSGHGSCRVWRGRASRSRATAGLTNTTTQWLHRWPGSQVGMGTA